MSTLTLDGLAKQYGGFRAVDGVSLDIAEGEAVGLLGPSGCGKTTTLRMVAGLIAPDAGAVRLDGADVTRMPAHRRNMGYVFQSYALFPHLSVERNVRFGLDERRVSRTDAAYRVARALAMVRLAGLEQRRPRELSGGQQQRVALARALVIRPAVLLLDESLSNLDAKLRDTMRHEIRTIQQDLRITTLFVTHDQVEALTLCDRIAVMDRGRIAQVGTPDEVYERPASRFVAEFMGRTNVLPATRDAAGRLLAWGIPLPVPRCAWDEADVLVRPGRIRLAPVSEPVGDGMARLVGQVVRRAFVGDHTEVVIEGEGGRLMAEVPSGAVLPREGDAVAALWPASDTLVFPRATGAADRGAAAGRVA